MGIGGVTYTDGRGRRREISSFDDVQKLVGDSRDRAASRRDVRRAPTMPPPAVGQGAESVRTMPGSAVVETQHGLALRGEEHDPTVAGNKVYSSVDGRKGYHSLDEIDPSYGGEPRIGPDFGRDDEDPVDDGKERPDGKKWKSQVLSRTRIEFEGGVATLVEFSKDIRVTPGSRVAGMTGERRREVGSWPIGGGEECALHPFHVEGYSCEEDGTPRWRVYLPGTCVTYGGSDFNVDVVDVTQYVDQETGESDEGWYVISPDEAKLGTDDVSSDPDDPTPLYFVVYLSNVDDNDAPCYAEFTTDWTDVGGERLLVVEVAEIYQIEETDDEGNVVGMSGAVSEQLVNSPIGVGVPPEPKYGAFRWHRATGTTDGENPRETGTISHCNFMFGRQAIHIENKTGCEYDRTWYLVIEHSSPESAWITDEPLDENDHEITTSLYHTVVPLFNLDSIGRIKDDYRAMPTIPAYGTEAS